MSYFTKYAPATVSDLVFHDPKIADLVRGLADGTFDHHLLMHGPAGSGKTSAAKMILKSQLGDDIKDFCIHGRELTAEKIDKFDGLRNYQRGFCKRAYFLIDEIDECTKVNRQHLRAFMDVNPAVTIISTTNYLSQLERDDPPFVDRFETAEMLVPTLDDWLPRLTMIAAAEGAPVSAEVLRGFLVYHTASARKLLRETEKFVAELRGSQTAPTEKVPGLKVPPSLKSKLQITPTNTGD